MGPEMTMHNLQACRHAIVGISRCHIVMSINGQGYRWRWATDDKIWNQVYLLYTLQRSVYSIEGGWSVHPVYKASVTFIEP